MNRPAALNRGLLGLLGLLLLAAGGFAVAAYFDVVEPPWETVVPGSAPPPDWVLYVTAAVAVVVGLLALRWLFAQLRRRPRTRTWRLDTEPERGRTELAPSAATAPFTDELTAFPGVHDAHATLAGGPHDPALALVVGVEQDADLSGIRTRLAEEGLPRLRRALDLPRLPATVEFRFTTITGRRVH